MSMDYSVHLGCDVKRTLGDGDVMVGERELLRRMKANGRAKTLEKLAKQQGKDVRTMRVVINEIDEEGQPVSYEVGYADLIAEVKPLGALQAACTNCPANGESPPRLPVRSSCQFSVFFRALQPLRTDKERLYYDAYN